MLSHKINELESMRLLHIVRDVPDTDARVTPRCEPGPHVPGD